MIITIHGVSEMRQQDLGKINIENYKVFYSRSTTEIHKHRVGITLGCIMAKPVKNFISIPSRIILVQLAATTVGVNIIQVYTSTIDKEGNQVKEFYQNINKLIKKLKMHDFTIFMRDFNAKLGSSKKSISVGLFGINERN